MRRLVPGAIRCMALITAFVLTVQAQKFSCKTFTSKDGLPSTYVYGASQDSLGYLWVGTYDGLSRYNGKSFVNYGLSDGLPDTRTWGIFVDSRKRYWASTVKGLAQMKRNRFGYYPFSDSPNNVWCGAIFEKKDANLWTLTSKGIYQLNGEKWDKIKLYPGYENHSCRTIIETQEGMYINYGDLLLIKKNDGSFKIIGSLKTSAHYYNQMTISAGQIFVSTFDGLCTIRNQELIQLPGLLGNQKDLYTYLCDSKKRIWISRAREGLIVFADGDTSHFTTVIQPSNYFLPQTITEDNNGNIWLGTGTGLVKIAEQGLQIFDTQAIIGNTRVIRNLLQPTAGPLLMNDGTLALQAFENGQFIKQPLQNSSHSTLPNNELIIDNYAFDDKDRYFYYVRGFDLVMQSGRYLYNQHKAYAHLGSEVFDVLFDRFRRKILLAIKGQKYPCQYDNGAYSVLTVANNADVKGAITKLQQCTNGTLLFATDRGILYSIDKQNICRQTLNEFKQESVIRRIYNGPSGDDVWILYAGMGARRYGWQGDSLIFKEQLCKASESSNDYVKDLCFDNDNRLWLCTSNDVAVFSKQRDTTATATYKMAGFFEAEDLNADGNPDTRLTKDSKGNIWFYSQRNLVCFNPEKINYLPAAPSIEIEEIKLNLKKTNWTDYADSLTGIFQLPYQLALKHDNNTLGFYFKGLSSSGTNGLLYSYLLEGLGNEWSPPTSNDFISFVKLPPGKYKFKVKAQLPNTNWSRPASFTFEIKKAFWQSGWFIAVCLAAAVLIIYSIYQNRIRQLKKMLAIRREISSDLHDEIGSALTSIQILSKVSHSNLEKDRKKAGDLLQKITTQSQNIQQSISDIVWAIKPGNDRVEDLVIRMREYLGQTAEPKNIAVEFLQDDQVLKETLHMQFRHHLFLIFKEAVNNAVKYAQAKKITIFLGRKNQQIVLSVTDNGTGFERQKTLSSNGLKNMEQRAKDLNGTLQIDSEKGKGTCVTLQCNPT